MESACVTIHEALKTVIDSQTHYRLREAQDRARAEDLNSQVSYWSIGETIALFVVSFSQVLLLKSFFTEKHHIHSFLELGQGILVVVGRTFSDFCLPH